MILVTGGTGTLGTHVVEQLRHAGRGIRVLGRSARGDEPGVEYMRGDTVAGDGLAAAVAGAEVVLHLAGGAKGDDVAAGHVAAAARAAGVEHLLLISVVGADAMPIGYFRAKAGAEEAIRGSGVPFTILRSAQFHEFVQRVLGGLAKSPVVPVARGLRFEPVAASEVAARLVELALGAPRGRVADIAGPEVLDVEQIVRPLAGGRRLFVPLRLPGAAGRAYRAGDNLAGDGAQRGTVTWEDFLATRQESFVP